VSFSRCPAGVGSWAAGFVQTPAPTFENEVTGVAALYTPELDHMISTLATILLPIRERAAFLEQVTFIFHCQKNKNKN